MDISPLWVVLALVLGFGISGFAICVEEICYRITIRKLEKEWGVAPADSLFAKHGEEFG